MRCVKKIPRSYKAKTKTQFKKIDEGHPGKTFTVNVNGTCISSYQLKKVYEIIPCSYRTY
jgi:hypothetical protein